MASFRKRGNTWQYRIKITNPITREQKEVSKGGFKTKKEAQLAASQEEVRIANGFDFNAESLDLKSYLLEWLAEYKKGNVKKNTYSLHELNVKTKIIPYFKEIKLKDITALHYQKFLNYLSEQEYSTRTIEIIHSTMHNAMSIAVSPLKKIHDNPCKNAIIPKKNIQRKKKLQYIDSDNISNFLRVARQDNYIYYIFFKTLIETGMRKGEAAALQRKDIDLKNGLISINKSLDFQPDSYEELFGETKTYESERTITMSQSLTKELSKHMDYLDEQRLVFSDIYKYDLDLVFCRGDGDYLPRSTLFNAFNRINKKAGIEKLPIHSLRHTHAVLLLESGASMKYIQERLGHKNISITSDVYSHISAKIEKETIKEYDDYVQNLLV